MGCDIHFYVEKRVNGKWETADKWVPNPYADESDDPVERQRKVVEDHIYSGRNYDLFAILADVRNGRGFAGGATGDGFVPIAEPRGLPEDVSPLVADESDGWGGDGHSHSHFTVAELMQYDWTQTTRHEGIVNIHEWAKFRLRGKPDSWSGMVAGQNVAILAPGQFEEAWQAVRANRNIDIHHAPYWVFRETPDVVADMVNLLGPNLSLFCQVSWVEPYFVSAGEFLSQTMPKLWRIGKPEDVRIVFWFDN